LIQLAEYREPQPVDQEGSKKPFNHSTYRPEKTDRLLMYAWPLARDGETKRGSPDPKNVYERGQGGAHECGFHQQTERHTIN